VQYQKINNLKLKIYEFAQYKTGKHYYFVFAFVVYYDAVNNSEHAASNDTITVKNELEKMCKEVVMV